MQAMRVQNTQVTSHYFRMSWRVKFHLATLNRILKALLTREYELRPVYIVSRPKSSIRISLQVPLASWVEAVEGRTEMRIES